MLRSLTLRSLMLGYHLQRAQLPRASWKWVGAIFSYVPHVAAHAFRR